MAAFPKSPFFYVYRHLHDQADSRKVQAGTRIAVMASPKATIDCVDAFCNTDFRSDLASFNIPTLIIHGTGDKTVPIDPTGRAAAKGIKGAKLIEYDGEPHGLFATAPDRLNKDLLSFIA